MATIDLVKPITVNGPQIVKKFPEAASQSYKTGAWVYLASGKVTVCASDATAAIGIALGDASGTTDTDTYVLLADPRTVFEVNCYKTGDLTNSITAITQVGSKYGLAVSGANGYCDIAEASALFFQVQGISPKDTVGDIYGRLLVKVLSDIYQLGPGEKTA